MAAPQARFDAAVKVIQSLPKNGSITPSHETMLTFYGYYKQATIGPCDISRPGFWDVVGKAKWEAWNRLGNMPKEEAMDNYVDTLKKIIEALPQDKEMQDFMHVLGPFYELVDLETPFQSGKSSLNQSELSISDQPVLAIKENGEIPTNHIGETLDDLQTNNNKNTEKSTDDSEQNETEIINQTQDGEAGKIGVQEAETNHRGEDVSTNQREEEIVTNQREADALTNHKQGKGDSSQSEEREESGVEVEEVEEEVQPGKGIDDNSPYGNQVTTPPVTKVMLMEIPTPPVIIDTPLPAKHHGKGPTQPDEDDREESFPKRLNGHSFPPHHVNSDSDTDSELYQDSVDTPAVPDEMPNLISRQTGATSPSSQTPEGLPRNNSFVTQAEIHHDSNGLPSHGALQQTEGYDGMEALSSSLPPTGDSSHMDDSYNNSFSLSPLIRQGRSGDVERRLELESPAVIGRGGGEMGGQGKGQSGQLGSRRQSGDSTSSGGRGARDRGGTPGRRGAGGYYGGGGGDDGERGRGRGQGPTDVNEHIAVALDRLQQDMNFVLARLSTLEALSTSQARGGMVAPAVQAVQPQQQQESSWWPFSNLSGKTAFFILVWPFIVNWLIKMYFKKKGKAHRRSPFM